MKKEKLKMKKFIVFTAAAFAFCLLPFALRASETVPQSQAVLKSYFNPTGATPGTNEFNELIDTMFWYVGSIWTNSQSAAQAANLLTNQTPAAFVRGTFSVSGYSGTLTVQSSYNITNITYVHPGGGYEAWTFNFVTPMVDTNYFIETVSGNIAGYGAFTSFTNLTQTTTNCQLMFAGNSSSVQTQKFFLRFWK